MNYVPITQSMRIAVIGMGISSLSLSILLSPSFKNIHIFERDSAFSQRRQGYGLTLLAPARRALKSMGLLDLAHKEDSPVGVHYVFDQHGNLRGFYGS